MPTFRWLTMATAWPRRIDAGANTSTGDLILNGPLSVDARNGIYGFVKRGTGSLRLNAAATSANSGLDIRAGSAICGINNCLVGANATLKVSAGATLDFNGFSQSVSNAVLAGGLRMSVNKGGGARAVLPSLSQAPIR